MKLSDYLEKRGRTAFLARAIGVHLPDVIDWKKGNRPVPIVHCLAIERATKGKVKRRDLRPNDWWLIWEE